MRFSLYLVLEIKFVKWPPFVRKSRNITGCLGRIKSNCFEQDNTPIVLPILHYLIELGVGDYVV